MIKTAILGGTFDPIHNGHMEMAEYALNHLGMDEVWLMPAKITPLKDRSITNAKERADMIELALEEEENIKLSLLEMEREGKSYTIDTARELVKRYPDREFYWLIGQDQAAQFDKWKDHDELLKLIHFKSFKRAGAPEVEPNGVEMIDFEPMDVSSTQIRKGQALYHLDPKVLNYIYDHDLYLESFLDERLKEKRKAHSISVANLARDIAACNGMDENQAYLAGIFHDIAKEMPLAQAKEWMEKAAPQHMDEPTPVWHAYVGAAITKEIYRIEDMDIYDAIYNHTINRSHKPLAKIIFAADKLDPLRGYDSSKLIEACKKDIYEGYEQVLKENEKYLKEKGKV